MADESAATSHAGYFQESDGSKSFSRLGTGFLLLNIAAWIWYCLITGKHFPVEAGVIAALTALGTCIYGANKFATALGAK